MRVTQWIRRNFFKAAKWFFRIKKKLWIELPCAENLPNICTWHTETLDSFFDLIRSHQQHIPWSPPLDIKPAITECSAETLPLSQQPTSHTSDTKSTSHGNCVANKKMYIKNVYK